MKEKEIENEWDNIMVSLRHSSHVNGASYSASQPAVFCCTQPLDRIAPSGFIHDPFFLVLYIYIEFIFLLLFSLTRYCLLPSGFFPLSFISPRLFFLIFFFDSLFDKPRLSFLTWTTFCREARVSIHPLADFFPSYILSSFLFATNVTHSLSLSLTCQWGSTGGYFICRGGNYISPFVKCA